MEEHNGFLFQDLVCQELENDCLLFKKDRKVKKLHRSRTSTCQLLF